MGNRAQVTSPEPDAGQYVLSDAAAPVADLKMNQYTRTPFDRREYDANGNLTVLQPSLANGDFDADGDVDMADYLVFQTTISGSGVKPAGGFTFTYDGHNQLVEAVDGAGKHHRYLYDALGRRIAKITDYQGAGQQEVRYFYRGSRVVEEQDQAGATLATYTYGNYVDEPLSMRRGSQEYYFLADDMFNTVAVADSTGALVEQYEYDDFGKPTIYDANGTVLATSAIGNPYLFTGRHYDPETGLYYYRSRYYDPRAGRFTSRDRIGIWGDPANLGNGFAYVSNNPWTYLDPFGLESPVSEPVTSPLKDLPKGWDWWDDPLNQPIEPEVPYRPWPVQPGSGLWSVVPEVSAAAVGTATAAVATKTGIDLFGHRVGYTLGPNSHMFGYAPEQKRAPFALLLSQQGVPCPQAGQATRPASQPTGKPLKPGQKLGGAGKPISPTVKHPTRKSALDAAQAETAKGKAPVKHTANPKKGTPPHYHAVDDEGELKPKHHDYPE